MAIDNLATLKIMSNAYLPPGTILVSPDIWAIMKDTYSLEGRDRAFLRAIGILTGSPDEPVAPV